MMSRARFNAIYGGLSSIAKKVYDGVPISEPWGASKIIADMQRRGISVDYKLASGCLNSLISAGLVVETSRGEFQREGIRTLAEPTPITQKDQPMPSAIKAVAKDVAPMDRLGDFARRVTGMSDMLKTLASEISDAAIEIQSQMEDSTEDSNKLRQLQTLLKGLGA